MKQPQRNTLCIFNAAPQEKINRSPSFKRKFGSSWGDRSERGQGEEAGSAAVAVQQDSRRDVYGEWVTSRWWLCLFLRPHWSVGPASPGRTRTRTTPRGTDKSERERRRWNARERAHRAVVTRTARCQSETSHQHARRPGQTAPINTSPQLRFPLLEGPTVRGELKVSSANIRREVPRSGDSSAPFCGRAFFRRLTRGLKSFQHGDSAGFYHDAAMIWVILSRVCTQEMPPRKSSTGTSFNTFHFLSIQNTQLTTHNSHSQLTFTTHNSHSQLTLTTHTHNSQLTFTTHTHYS